MENDKQKQEKIKYIHKLIEKAFKDENEDNIDIAIEKLNALVKSFK